MLQRGLGRHLPSRQQRDMGHKERAFNLHRQQLQRQADLIKPCAEDLQLAKQSSGPRGARRGRVDHVPVCGCEAEAFEQVAAVVGVWVVSPGGLPVAGRLQGGRRMWGFW